MSLPLTDTRGSTDRTATWYSASGSGPDLVPENDATYVVTLYQNGVQVATTHQRYAEKYFSAGSTVKNYQTQDEANNDLAAGRLDYVQADNSALKDFLKTDQGSACCEMKGQVPEDKEILGEGVGGGLRKEDTELKAKLDAAITALAKAGEIQKITDKYEKLKGEILLPK